MIEFVMKKVNSPFLIFLIEQGIILRLSCISGVCLANQTLKF